MPEITVDTMHARYRSVRPANVAVLDDALSSVARHGLGDAVAGRLAVTPAAEHVCLRRLHVATSLDSSLGSAAVTRAWSAVVAQALAERLDAHDGGADLVVYPRTADAVVDVVRALARGDGSRAWAWRMAGVLDAVAERALRARSSGGPSPSPRSPVVVPRGVADAVVERVLLRRPELVPLVWARSANLPRLPLSPYGWLAVAHAVAGLHLSPPSPVTAVAGADPSPPLVRSGGDVRLARQLPWAYADPAQRRDLAVLLLACTHPARVRHEPTVSAAVETWARLTGAAPPAAPAPDVARGPEAERTPAQERRGADGPDGSPGGRRAEAVSGTVGADEVALDSPEPVTSRYGGLLLLLSQLRGVADAISAPGHPLAALPLAETLARLGARLAGAPPQDPAVRAVAGWTEPDAVPEAPVPAAAESALAALAATLTARLRAVLGEPDEPLDWLWLRQVTLLREPGWLEAEFRLSDVDLRVRRAGLDLDPGYVWWLGSVVRFRYA